MKTAEIKPLATYALRERSYSYTNPALVLEKALWDETSKWFSKEDGDGREERRILRRAEKGARAGHSSMWSSSSRKTGVPVLRLSEWDSRFLSEADPEDRITDSAHELLTRAMEKLQLLDLVDSEQSVFDTDDEGQSHRKTRTTVMAQYADGRTGEVSVELELVRPQSILAAWDEHLEQAERLAVQKADLAQKTAERKAANDKTAWSIRDRVGALLDDAHEQRYNTQDERYDVHREWTSGGITSKYEISESTLLKLLELAERGASQ